MLFSLIQPHLPVLPSAHTGLIGQSQTARFGPFPLACTPWHKAFAFFPTSELLSWKGSLFLVKSQSVLIDHSSLSHTEMVWCLMLPAKVTRELGRKRRIKATGFKNPLFPVKMAPLGKHTQHTCLTSLTRSAQSKQIGVKDSIHRIWYPTKRHALEGSLRYDYKTKVRVYRYIAIKLNVHGNMYSHLQQVFSRCPALWAT